MYSIKNKPFYVKYWNGKIDVNVGINPRKQMTQIVFLLDAHMCIIQSYNKFGVVSLFVLCGSSSSCFFHDHDICMKLHYDNLKKVQGEITFTLLIIQLKSNISCIIQHCTSISILHIYILYFNIQQCIPLRPYIIQINFHRKMIHP